MYRIKYSEFTYGSTTVFAVMIGIFFVGSNYIMVHAQQASDLNIGNSSSIASDTFFQLEDSIEFIKTLVNNTQFAIDDGNTTAAKDFLNQAYNELIQISNNSNNLIWDVSNEGN